jgi:hypothetical protein
MEQLSMSFFLSLARGDFEARNLLKEAVLARYAARPVPLEKLRLTLRRQARIWLGVPLTIVIEAAYAEPDQWSWRERHKLFGVVIGGQREALAEQTDPALRESLHRQQWAFRALMLTPLTREGVTVRAVAERAFQAVHDDQPEAIATIYLKPDYNVAAVEIERYRAADKRRLPYTLRPEGGYQTFDGINLPAQIAEQWGSESSLLYAVKAAQADW